MCANRIISPPFPMPGRRCTYHLSLSTGITIILLLLVITFTTVLPLRKINNSDRLDLNNWCYSEFNPVWSTCLVSSRVDYDFTRSRLLRPGKNAVIPIPVSEDAEDWKNPAFLEIDSLANFVDTVICSSIDSVEQPPELIWMKYPDCIPEKSTISSGMVLLNILVDQYGSPIEIIIIGESPENLGLGQQARQAVETSVFKPAVRNHCLVKCWYQIKLEF